MVIVQFNCVVSAAVPERVNPLAVDQYLIQLMFRSNQVHPGPLPTIRLRKSLLDKSKVALLAQVNEAFTIYISCVIVTVLINNHRGIHLAMHANSSIKIPKNEIDLMFLCLIKIFFEGYIYKSSCPEEDEHSVGAYTTVEGFHTMLQRLFFRCLMSLGRSVELVGMSLFSCNRVYVNTSICTAHEWLMGISLLEEGFSHC